MSTTRTRRSHQQWQALIARYETGTLTQTAFCRAHGLALSSFGKWHRRLTSGSADRAAPVPAAMFTELDVPAWPTTTSPGATWDIELKLGSLFLRIRRDLPC